MADAAENKDVKALTALLGRRADVNAPQPDGTTALAWAVHWDDLKTTNLLLQAGAKVDVANDNGATPLWLACYNGSAPMVERLLEAGANPNATHLPAGETALIRCSGTGSVEAVKSLLAHGADINAKEEAGQTALMWAIEERHPGVARMLIERGADVNAASRGGFTPLLFAARQGDIETARILLEKGVTLDAAARASRAAKSGGGKGELLWFQQYKQTLDPLFLSIHSGREQFAIFLLDRGANPNAVDDLGMVPLHYVFMSGISDLSNAVRDPHHGIADFIYRPNMIELASALLNKGANPNARILRRVPPSMAQERPKVSLIGATPFLLAAATGDVKTMKLLLDKGADPKLTTEDGTTALMAAAGVSRRDDRTREEERAALEALKLTVELGGDVNAVTQNGLTAMHGAAFTGSNEIIEYVASQGAKLDVRDKFGESPLSIALGDPNGLAEEITRSMHETTVALLRKLMNDYTSLVDATPSPAASQAKTIQ